MKIYFGLGYIEDEPIELAKTWQDIQKSKLLGPTRHQYQVFKLLEHNRVFWKEITKSRKKIGIPLEGISWKAISGWKNKYPPNKEAADEYIKALPKDSFKILMKERERLEKILTLHPFVYDELHDLLQANYVFTYPKDPIMWDAIAHDEADEPIYDLNKIKRPEGINIYINETVTKNQLIKFIESNWNQINPVNQKLTSIASLTLSNKDKQILSLRESGKTYAEIADILTNSDKSRNIDGSINEDSVKTAYHRTLEKISSIASPKKGNKNKA